MFVVVEFNCWYCTSLQFNDQLESARELETQQAQLRGQIQEAQKHVSIIWSPLVLRTVHTLAFKC